MKMKIDELNTYESEQRGEALIFADIPNEAYHAGVGISSSAIRRFGESQLHAIEHVQETTPAMNFGTAAHAMLVEGDEAFNNDIAVLTGSPYTNANKELKKEYEERGLTVIKEAELNHIRGMKANMIEEGNMYLNPEGKLAEASFYWYEDEVLCKCRPDVLCPPLTKPYADNSVVVIDYKTTQSCDPKAFAGSVRKYGYDMQAAWYRRGMQKAGFKVQEFVFVAQEKVPPYAAKVFRITEEQMDIGWERMEGFLKDYKNYSKGGHLSIYNSPNIVDLIL
jgi:hypothetical protein